MVRLPIAVALLILAPNILTGQETENQVRANALQSLGWMAGSWVSKQGESETEETWMSPKSGLMLGTNRTVRADGKTAFEFLRLVQEGNQVTYFASPSGKPPTPFVLTESSDTKAVFENSAHDFPQRIIYERDKNQLHSRIEGTTKGVKSSMEWHWKLAGEPNGEQTEPVTQKKPAFQGLRTAIYKTKDLDAAKKWYTNVLGIDPYFDQPFYVGFRVGGFELGLDPDLKDITFGNNQPVYWGVTDCKDSYRRLLELGARESSKPEEVGDGVIAATVVDPFGNYLGIIQNPHFKSEQ